MNVESNAYRYQEFEFNCACVLDHALSEFALYVSMTFFRIQKMS